jgi:hypothetical protein
MQRKDADNLGLPERRQGSPPSRKTLARLIQILNSDYKTLTYLIPIKKIPPLFLPHAQTTTNSSILRRTMGTWSFSGTQLSGSKEALENPPEDERHSKRVKTTTPTHVKTNE